MQVTVEEPFIYMSHDLGGTSQASRLIGAVHSLCRRLAKELATGTTAEEDLRLAELRSDEQVRGIFAPSGAAAPPSDGAKRIEMYGLHGSCMELRLPRNTQILHVGDFNGMLMMWVLRPVTKEASHYGRRVFRVFGTNDPVPNGGRILHLGTVQMSTGMTRHVFEEV